MGAKKLKRSSDQLKQDKQRKQDIHEALAISWESSGVKKSNSEHRNRMRLLARNLLKELDPVLFTNPKTQPKGVAVPAAAALCRIVEVCLENLPKTADEQKQDLDLRFKQLKSLKSARDDLLLELVDLRKVDRLRPEGLDRLLSSPRTQRDSGLSLKQLKSAASTREFLSTPEIKGLILRYGSFENATGLLLSFLPDLALYGWIPWMNDQDTFVKDADQDAILRAWAPLAENAFGKPRWDLLTEIINSTFMGGYGFLKTSRDRIKGRAAFLGLSKRRSVASR